MASIAFKNLPFTPVPKQVIYMGNGHDKNVKAFIVSNLSWIKEIFKEKGFDFCYLPVQAQGILAYHAPYLNAEMRKKVIEEGCSLSQYVAQGQPSVLAAPSLVFALDNRETDCNGNVVLQSVEVKFKWYKSKTDIFIELLCEVVRATDEGNQRNRQERSLKRYSLTDDTEDNSNGIRYSFSLDSSDDTQTQPQAESPKTKVQDIKFAIVKKGPAIRNTDGGVRFAIAHKTSPITADETFENEATKLVEEIKERIAALKNLGVNTLILHSIIDNMQHLSELRITKDHRIFMTDFENREITMPMLVKAVFFLFLRHPEGIRFKELQDYKGELSEIYEDLAPKGSQAKHEKSIDDVVDPLNNSINEKCARIREAFISNFDEHLIEPYIVTGKRGEPKRINIDRKKVIWD